MIYLSLPSASLFPQQQQQQQQQQRSKSRHKGTRVPAIMAPFWLDAATEHTYRNNRACKHVNNIEDIGISVL